MIANILKSLFVFCFLLPLIAQADTCVVWIKSTVLKPNGSGTLVSDLCQTSDLDSLLSQTPACLVQRTVPCRWLSEVENRGLVETWKTYRYIESKKMGTAELDLYSSYATAANFRQRSDSRDAVPEGPADKSFLVANFKLDLISDLNADIKPFLKDITYQRKDQVSIWTQLLKAKVLPRLENRVETFPDLSPDDKSSLKRELHSLLEFALGDADQLIQKDEGETLNFRRLILQKKLKNLNLATTTLTLLQQEEWLRILMRLRKGPLPDPSLLSGLDSKELGILEQHLDALTNSLKTLSRLTDQETKNQRLSPQTIFLQAAKNYLDKPDRLNFRSAWTAFQLSVGNFHRLGNERWDEFTSQEKKTITTQAVFSEKNVGEPIICKVYSEQIVPKRRDYQVHLKKLLDEISETISKIALGNPEETLDSNSQLQTLSSTLDDFISTNSLWDTLGLAEDRELRLNWRFDEVDFPHEYIGQRFQIEFIQIGDFHWEPAFGIGLKESLAELVMLESYGSSAIDHGLGRLGPDRTLELRFLANPETACLGKNVRLILRFPSMDEKQYFALEGALN